MSAEDLLARVAALSAAQRELLAGRLAALGAQDEPGLSARRLVAWVVGAGGAPLDSKGLRDFASARLPDYMVPAAFVALDELPRTPAGKIDRAKLPAAAPEATAPERFTAPGNAAEETLAGIWAEVLGMDEVGVHDDFFELGGDSLLSIRILARANQAGLRIAPERFFEHPTVAGQAALARDDSAPVALADQPVGEAALSPIQHWFFERIEIDPQHWNQSLLLAVQADLEAPDCARAIDALLAQHDALRAVFERHDGAWRQRIVPVAEHAQAFESADLSALAGIALSAAIEQIATRANATLDLRRGPLLRAIWLRMPAGQRNRVLLVAHHLVVDALSWRILLEDFDRLCGQLLARQPLTLGARTSSFRAWTARLAEHAGTAPVQAELGFWLSVADGAGEPPPALPLDRTAAPADNRVTSAHTLTESLDRATTRTVLHELTRAFHTRINDVLLAALTRTIGAWSERGTVLIDLEGHGREALFDDLNVSRTVGWFTTVFPVLLQHDPADDPAALLKRTKEQLRQIPGNGLGHGLLRELTAAGSALRAAPAPALCFNYLGRLQPPLTGSAALELLQENCGAVRSGNGVRAYLLEVNAQVVDDCLQLHWTYSDRFHDRATVAGLAADYLQILREIAACDVADGGFTPSDFPLADLQQSDLENLASALGRIDGIDAADPDR